MTDLQKRKKSVKRILFWTSAALVVVFLLVAFLPGFLSTGAGTSFLLKRINRSMDGHLTIEKLSVGWFRPVHLQNLHWQDTAGQTQVRIDSLTARLRWLALLNGRISLTDAVVEGPFLQVQRPVAVSDTPQKSEPAPKSSPGPDYRFGPIELEIRQGQAVFEQARPAGQPPMQLYVRNLASTIVLNRSGQESAVSLSMDVGDESQQGSVRAHSQGFSLSSTAGLAGVSGQFDVEIKTLSLASLRPLLALAGKDVQMAGTLDATAAVKINNGQIKNLQITADLRDFEQNYEGRTIRLEQPLQVRTRLSDDGGNWMIEQVEVESSFFRLAGKGGLNALEYTLTADLAQTQAFSSPFVDWKAYQLGGNLSAGGRILWQDQAVQVAGQVNIRELSVQQGARSMAFSELRKDYDLTVFPDLRAVQIRQAILSAQPIGTIRLADAAVNWSKPDLQAELDLTGTLDLRQASPVVHFFYPLPPDLSMEGTVHPDARLELKEGTLRVLTASTTAEKLAVSKVGSEPFTTQKLMLKADLLWDLKKNELLHLKDFAVDSDAIRIRGNLQPTGTGEKSQLVGKAQAEYDLKEVSALARPFFPQGLNLEGKRNDQFRFSVRRTNSGVDWRTLQADGSFGFEKAAYKGLNLGASEIKLMADEGIVGVDIADTPVNEGLMRLAGDMDLTSTPPVFRLRKPMTILENVHLNDELTRNLLEYVNPLFAGASRVSGIADFSCDEFVFPLGIARKDLLKIKSVLAIRQITMRSDSFLKELLTVLGTDPSVVMTLHPTMLTLEKEVLSYQNMQIDVGRNPVVFSGRIGLNRRTQLEMKMPWTLSGQSVRPGQDPADRIVLPVGGTIDKPQVDWGKVLQLNLGRLLLKEILQ